MFHTHQKYNLKALYTFACIVSWMLCYPLNAMGQDDTTKSSIVKLAVTQRSFDHSRPWAKSNATDVSGTGFVISGKRIITNAHVVRYASQIYVQLKGSDEKLEAKVQAIAHDLDLAVVALEDDTKLDDIAPLEIDDSLTPLRTEVLVYGFPIGGDQLSVTKGIVSRVEFTQIALARSGLRVQVDAAVNPGNSGGPALANGKVIGVVYSVMGNANNIGFLVHASELTRFLKDIEDGQYDGAPLLSVMSQTTENPSLRKRLGLPANTGGVLIHTIDEKDQEFPLKKFDVITKIGPHPIDAQGNVKVDDLNLHFRYYSALLAVEDKVPLTVWRDGQELEVQCPARRGWNGIMPFLNGGYPQYCIIGPLVFSTVTADVAMLLMSNPQALASLSARKSPMVSNFQTRRFDGDKELVYVSSPQFSHRLMKGYGPLQLLTVKSINGVEVGSLVRLIELIQSSQDEFLEFEFYDDGVGLVILNRREFLDSTESILEENSVRVRCSPGLEKYFKGE